jgi:hypothetical protein
MDDQEPEQEAPPEPPQAAPQAVEIKVKADKDTSVKKEEEAHDAHMRLVESVTQALSDD